MKQSFVQDLLGAAERGDRASFDRIFDAGFALVYALAFQRAAGDRECAEQMTSRVLEQSVRNALGPAPIRDVAADVATSQERENAA